MSAIQSFCQDFAKNAKIDINTVAFVIAFN